MASILFCSEIGADSGHLTPHREVLDVLHQRGHSIHIVVRDLTRATKAFEGLPLQYWQAPIPQSRPEFVFNPPINFSHILHNSGMGDPIGIAARMAAWRSILSATRPRLAILDHSPAALLALRGTKVQTVLIGSGFEIPANASPIPAFGVTANLAIPGKMAADDNRLLIAFNAALARHGCPALTSVAQLFHEVPTTIFRTLPEFDPVPNRGPAQFLGLPSDPPRKAVEWPPGEGARVFAYLKPSEILDTLLTELNDLKLPTIIASDGISKAQRDKYSTATVRFVPPTVDIVQMGRESHFAITNASLTTSVRLLLQGCPLITIPLQLEQAVTADNIRRLGAGLIVRANVKEDVARSLSEMLNHARCRNAAQAFAAKYAGQPDNYAERVVAILDGLLGPSALGLQENLPGLQENLPAAAVPAAPAPVLQIPRRPLASGWRSRDSNHRDRRNLQNRCGSGRDCGGR